MSEQSRERAIDSQVQARLATDAAYRNAESAEEQAEREREIEQAVVAAFDRERAIAQAAIDAFQHEIHDGFCYTHQVWVNRPGELEAHVR